MREHPEESQLLTLDDKQWQALELIIAGETDAEVAQAVGVARETINRWKLHHPGFQSELNKWRRILHQETTDELRRLVAQSAKVTKEVLEDRESPDRLKVAMKLLLEVNPLRSRPEDIGPMEPEGIIDEMTSKMKVETIVDVLEREGQTKNRREVVERLLRDLAAPLHESQEQEREEPR